MNLSDLPRMVALQVSCWPLRLRAAVWTCCILLSSQSFSAPYSEIVLPFKSKRPYRAVYNASENSVQVEILKTTTSELAPVERYDEDLIRRLLVKDRGPEGVEVKLTLRDRDVVATVADFDEPHRIVISVFKKGYQPVAGVDGVPMTGGDTSRLDSSIASNQNGAPRLSNPETDNASSRLVSERNADKDETRRLFQSAPAKIENSVDLCVRLQRTSSGVGSNWKNLQAPIYRLDPLPRLQKLAGRIPGAQCEAAMKSNQGLATLAENLYSDGQESRALLLYQQLLFYDPATIERDPGNLWRMAEVHFGQGNISLAAGYYDILAKRFPGSPQQRLAIMRLADVTVVQASMSGAPVQIEGILKPVRAVQGDADYNAGVILRAAYWRQSGQNPVATDASPSLPRLVESDTRELHSSIAAIKHPRTRFLAYSLLLNERLSDDVEWTSETGKFAAEYFKSYKAKAYEPENRILSDKLKLKISSALQGLSLAGRHVEAVQTYESLPKSLQSIRKDPPTAWALAEAYRGIGQPQPATALYEVAASAGVGVERFKAQFWLAQTAFDTAELLIRKKAGATRISPFQRKSIEADRGMNATWKGLKPSEREQLYASFRTPLEASLGLPARLRTPPKVILESWRTVTASRQSATSGEAPEDPKSEFAPSASTANLASTLASRFAVLGMERERREALGFMRSMKPSEFGSDVDAKKAWQDQLLKLAEEYRKDNEYLEAGRIFNLVANEATDWEGRAETLYKAGLLLYRAGRKDEAVAALEKAKSDGNNLFYANLATERLNQINRK